MIMDALNVQGYGDRVRDMIARNRKSVPVDWIDIALTGPEDKRKATWTLGDIMPVQPHISSWKGWT